MQVRSREQVDFCIVRGISQPTPSDIGYVNFTPQPLNTVISHVLVMSAAPEQKECINGRKDARCIVRSSVDQRVLHFATAVYL